MIRIALKLGRNISIAVAAVVAVVVSAAAVVAINLTVFLTFFWAEVCERQPMF